MILQMILERSVLWVPPSCNGWGGEILKTKEHCFNGTTQSPHCTFPAVGGHIRMVPKVEAVCYNRTEGCIWKTCPCKECASGKVQKGILPKGADVNARGLTGE